MFQRSMFYLPNPAVTIVNVFNRSRDRHGLATFGIDNPVSAKGFIGRPAISPRTVFRWLWRVFMGASLALSGAAMCATAGTYTTDFSLTENPISEGGHWVNGKSAGLDWSDCATINHLAYGAQITENPNGNPFNDSTAVLTGSWGPNQSVSGVVSFDRSGTLNNNYLEIELRLNSSISAHSCTGYEIDYSANIPPLRTGYIYIVRWNGPFGDFTGIGPGTNGAALNLHTGDTISATMSNGTIRAFINGTNFLTATDSNPFTGGSPGIGFDMAGDHSQSVNYGFTSFSATDGATSDTQAPSVPSNVTVTSTSSNRVNLAWTASTDNVGVAGYHIFRNGAQVATSSGAFYSDTGLSPSTTYTYTINAFDAAGNSSGQSAPVNATTQNVTTQAGTATPSLVQTAGNTDSSSGTTLAQAFSSANTSGNLIVVVTSWANSAANPTVTDSAGNAYTLAVSTYSSSGDQSQAIYYAKNIRAGANTVTVNYGGSHAWRRILIGEYRGIDPNNPVDGLGANQGSASTATDNATSSAATTTASGDLIFGAVANYNARGSVSAGTGFSQRSFLLYNSVIEMAIEDRIQSSAGSAAATFTFAIADSYIAQMVAFRAASAGGDTVPPSVPASLSATAVSASNINLSWAASTDNVAVTGYRIFRNGVQAGTSTTSSYSDTGLSPSTTYTYTVAAFDGAGNASAQSSSVSATTPASNSTDTTPPSVPANLNATAPSSSQINLTWTASTDNMGVTGYRIFRNGAQIATSPGASYSNTGLSAGTTYTYTVSAFDAAGNSSGQSSPVSATTQANGSKPSLAQTAGNTDSSSGTTLAQAFSSANTSGNLIVVVTSWANSTAAPTLSDSAGNTYALATSTYSPSGDQSQAIYYAKNIKAGANTVTVNYGGSHAWRRILISEYRGLDPINPVDGVAANQATASTAKDNVTSGTVTTTSNGDLLFGAIANYNARGSVSVGTGFTQRSFLIYNNVIETAIEDKTQNSAGSTAATFTLGTADSYIAQIVAFRASGH